MRRDGIFRRKIRRIFYLKIEFRLSVNKENNKKYRESKN